MIRNRGQKSNTEISGKYASQLSQLIISFTPSLGVQDQKNMDAVF